MTVLCTPFTGFPANERLHQQLTRGATTGSKKTKLQSWSRLIESGHLFERPTSSPQSRNPRVIRDDGPIHLHIVLPQGMYCMALTSANSSVFKTWSASHQRSRSRANNHRHWPRVPQPREWQHFSGAGSVGRLDELAMAFYIEVQTEAVDQKEPLCSTAAAPLVMQSVLSLTCTSSLV